MPKLVFSTSGARKAVEDQERINKSAREYGQEVDENKRKAIEFDRAVTNIQRRNETAQEKQNRLLAEAKVAWDKQRISAEEYDREVKQINREVDDGTGRFRKFNDQNDKAFGAAALARVGAYAAGILSVHTAAQLVTRELESQAELRAKAQDTKLTISQSRSLVAGTLTDSSQADVRRILGQNRALASELNIGEQFINKARADALSSSGGDEAASLAAVTGAARFLADRPDEISSFAGSLLDIAGVTGTNDATVNLGLLTKVGGLSRVVNARQQAVNIPRALINMGSFGGDARTSAAVFAALSVGSGDVTGATSGTGGIKLAEQLRRASTESDKRYIEALAGTTSMEQRIAVLQSNQTAAQKFLADASFESTVGGAIEQLLVDPTSKTARKYRENLSAIPGTAGLRAAGQQAIENVNADFLVADAERSRILSSYNEELQLKRRSVLSTQEVQNLRDILTTQGGLAIGSQFQTYVSNLAGGITTQDAIGFVESRIDALRTPNVAVGNFGQAGVVLTKDPEQLQKAESLERLLEKLVQISERQLEGQNNAADTGTATGTEVTAE